MTLPISCIAWAPTPKISLLANKFRVGIKKISAGESDGKGKGTSK